jgi:rhodanese-related sulfurtransferase
MHIFALILSFALAAPADITPAAVQAEVSQGKAILVDVREADEVAEGKIEGAKTFPLSKMNTPEWATFMKTLPKDKTIYTYCASGGRATKVATALKAKGFHAQSAGGYEDLLQAQPKAAKKTK